MSSIKTISYENGPNRHKIPQHSQRLFSLTEKDDERENQFRKQRMERGFDDSETWSLDYTVASFIIPRLERYQELANERLARDKQLIREVDMLLEAMKLIVKDEGSHLWNEKEKI